jgi:hypothetical protein
VNMAQREGYQTEAREIAGWKVNVVSYAIGERYYCHVDNVDPGAVIARTEAATREEAMLLAIAKATERLPRTTR